ncbi:unnamed protein product [Trichogramma brassicae]|uniref:MADF domain-containing protein n=1 Tax=Trichogramma brassicae TaxID=86971 RepID=A0A6H5I7Z5_9HYME|nr:unnamed protein product [Trichogramma brassicae]
MSNSTTPVSEARMRRRPARYSPDNMQPSSSSNNNNSSSSRNNSGADSSQQLQYQAANGETSIAGSAAAGAAADPHQDELLRLAALAEKGLLPEGSDNSGQSVTTRSKTPRVNLGYKKRKYTRRKGVNNAAKNSNNNGSFINNGNGNEHQATPPQPPTKRPRVANVLLENEILIDEIRARKALWMRTHDQHHSNLLTAPLWDEIANILDSTPENVKRRWKSMKDHYRRELKKEMTDPALPQSPWPYYKKMKFMKSQMFVSMRRTDGDQELEILSADEEDLTNEWQNSLPRKREIMDDSEAMDQYGLDSEMRQLVKYENRVLAESNAEQVDDSQEDMDQQQIPEEEEEEEEQVEEEEEEQEVEQDDEQDETSKCNDPRAIRVAIDEFDHRTRDGSGAARGKAMKFNLFNISIDDEKKRGREEVCEREREKKNIIITLARASDSNFSAGYVNLMGRSSRACLRGYEDEPEVDKDGKPSLHRTTAVHRAARNDKIVGVRNLFMIHNRFDVNYTDDDGLTHFHVACMTGCGDVVEKFLKLGQVDPNCLVPKTGDSPLHISLRYEHEKVVQLLLRNGADPNLADAKGSTPLHVICKRNRNHDGLLEEFFEINDEKHQLVQVDARDMFGNTPLHLLCKFAPYAIMLVAESLLQRGADPNLSDEDGLTPLHIICKRGELDDNAIVDYLFELCKVNRPLQVNAADKLGQTPLHLAVEYGFEELVEELLTKGADQNRADAEGLTPLHVICQRCPGDDLASSFFHYNDKLQQTVQVNVRDKLGRTPLQAAVARFLPETVNELLNRGADMSTFVFPTDSYSSEKIYLFKYRWITFKLRLASGALDVIKNLDKGGYELKQTDALTVMKFFAKNELFEKSSDLEKSWRDDEEFVSGAKKIITRHKMSLYDLIQFKSKEAANLLIRTDFRLGHSENFDKASRDRFRQLPKEPSEACAQYLLREHCSAARKNRESRSCTTTIVVHTSGKQPHALVRARMNGIYKRRSSRRRRRRSPHGRNVQEELLPIFLSSLGACVVKIEGINIIHTSLHEVANAQSAASIDMFMRISRLLRIEATIGYRSFNGTTDAVIMIFLTSIFFL